MLHPEWSAVSFSRSIWTLHKWIIDGPRNAHCSHNGARTQRNGVNEPRSIGFLVQSRPRWLPILFTWTNGFPWQILEINARGIQDQVRYSTTFGPLEVRQTASIQQEMDLQRLTYNCSILWRNPMEHSWTRCSTPTNNSRYVPRI